jgi:hypothetical protein
MVSEVHRLSAVPATTMLLDDYIMRVYYPALSARVALSAKMDAQSNLILGMRSAMAEPKYAIDLAVELAERAERARAQAQMDAEVKLIHDVSLTVTAAEIKGKIKSGGCFYPEQFTERPSVVERGTIAAMHMYCSYNTGRTLAVNWGVLCVVLERVETGYVVCRVDEYDDLQCRLVKEDELFGPPMDFDA